jgi:Ca2+:H+ antiporter
VLRTLTTAERLLLVLAFAATAIAALLRWIEAPAALIFAATTIALAGIAYLIGEATSQLSNHVAAPVAGTIQSALGNLPELLICIFALQAGSVDVVQSALVGSILTTAMLVLGAALTIGSMRHGMLKFESRTPRMIAVLLTLAVSALALPTLAHELYLPAALHEHELAVTCAVALLTVFALSTYVTIRNGGRKIPPEARMRPEVWPMPTILLLLSACGLTILVLSDWFIEALEPASAQIGVSEAFASLVVVGLVSNTFGIVEIRLALEGKVDLAVSVALNSASQVALALIPVLVLISFFFFADTPFTLTIPPIMAVALMLSILVVTLVCMDGRADVVDGAALVALYVLIAAIFWWG